MSPRLQSSLFVRSLWAFVWHRYLHDGPLQDCFDSVYRVKGWRTAIIESASGGRITVTCCPRWIWWEEEPRGQL